MVYRIAAELLVFLHLAFIIFALLGGLLVLKWHWLALLHLPAVVWGAIVEYRGWVCPLTPWENRLRQLAGQEGYSEGFIEHYIMALVYPAGLTRDVQFVLGSIVLLVNLIIYGWFVLRMFKN